MVVSTGTQKLYAINGEIADNVGRMTLAGSDIRLIGGEAFLGEGVQGRRTSHHHQEEGKRW